MSAYYNEIDPYAAAWLRNLIKDGHIADGVVDERSISDVKPEELFEFTQCHFFAGIGVWSHALRSAGWEDDRPVWTGSCPCQPFSGAGNRKGMADERHLWPHWFHLIEECRPPTVFGEQVASKDGLGWIDLVQADMEGADYAIGAFDLCSAGFGAPHIRQRLWFVADTDNPRSQGWISGRSDTQRQDQHGHVGRGGTTDRLAYAESEQGASRDHGGEPRETGEPQQIQSGGSGSGTVGVGDTDHGGSQGSGETRVGQGVEHSGSQSGGTNPDVGLAHTTSGGRQHEPSEQSTGVQSQEARDAECRTEPSGHGTSVGRMDNAIGNGRHEGRFGDHGSNDRQQPDPDVEDGRAKQTNGAWSDVDWLLCRDGKWRPVEPDTFPLAHGATARVGRLRAYGNAITAPVAQGLIESYMEVR